MEGKCIIISAPSGAGKTTIVRALLKEMPQLAFSISACSREPRGLEKNGVDYYFFGKEGFEQRIADNALSNGKKCTRECSMVRLNLNSHVFGMRVK